MILAILLAIYAIILISVLIYIASIACAKHDRKIKEQYQEHIDNLVEELFPPSVQPLSIQPPAAQAQAINEDLEYQETKRNMVANIRTYFNQRKINAAVADMPGPDELAPVNPFSKQTFPSPPSLQRIL